MGTGVLMGKALQRGGSDRGAAGNTARAEAHERNESLWLLAASPLVWGAHFIACYLTVAIWCAKAVGRDGGLGWTRWAIGVYTLAALAGIAAIGWSGARRHTFADPDVAHHADLPESRRRFLGLAILLLSGLSAIATIFDALPAVFIGTCN